MRYLLGILLTAGLVACGGDAATDSVETAEAQPLAVLIDGSGTYSRPIGTKSAEAQAFFDQGLRLTGGYFFPDAAATLLEARRQDPNNAMILWGLALASGPNPNSRYTGAPDDPKGAAKEFIEQAYAMRESVSDVERDLIEALYIRFDDETYPDRDARDQAYLEATRELHARYPEDPDVAALLADAFMVTLPWTYWDENGDPAPGTQQVVDALEASMALHPDHPGTNHLFIHIMEASDEPERALPQADRLESLMPVAGHIVHMPTHIYVRVGDQDKAIAFNERSVAADERFKTQWGDIPYPDFVTYPLSARLHATHAYDFIRYAATIKGDYERALEASANAEQVVLSRAPLSNGRAQRTVAATWMLHKIFGNWDAIVKGSGPPEAGHQYLDGMWAYVRGSALNGTGDLAGAKAELEELSALANAAQPDSVLVMVTPPSYILKIARLDLAGEIALSEGRIEDAVAAFEQAVEMEDGIGYMEPPDWPHPMRLSLASALMTAGQPGRAEAVYREDLDWNRNNPWAMKGLCESLKALGKTDAAAKVCSTSVAANR